MLDGLKGEGYSFAEVVLKARERCESTFSTAAKEATIDDTDWSWEEELVLLQEEVGIVADQCRKDETKKMVNQIEVRSMSQIIHSFRDSMHVCVCSPQSRNNSRNLLNCI